MPCYRVTYGHENENSTDPKKQYGFGVTEIEVDELVETREHLIEVARAIGLENGYTSVAITDIKLAVRDAPK